MWQRDLIDRLNLELPRWRWKAHLTHRGGTIEGSTQKQHVRLQIKYARGHWVLNAHGLFGCRQPQWELTIENGKFTSLDELGAVILAECT